ncbi:IS66 family transposase [Ligilactobacillus equi]
MATKKDLEKQVEELKEQVKEFKKQLDKRDEVIEMLLQRQYGKKTEKLADGQMSLLSDEELENLATEEDETTVVIEKTVPTRRTPKKKKSSGKRNKILDQFEQRDVIHDKPGKMCKCCGEKMIAIGKKCQYRELRQKPAEFECVNHYVRTYKCSNIEEHDNGNEVLAQAIPETAPLFNHSYFSASSLAEIIRNKYELAIPLNRQEILFKSYGLPITSKQMSEGVIKLSQRYLQPLYDRLLEELLLEEVIHMDETPYEVLAKNTKSHKTYIWAVRSTVEFSNHQIVFYKHSDTRGSSNIADILGAKYCGAIICDGWTGYSSNVYPEITFGACLVHIRRKFVEIAKVLRGKTHSVAREATVLLGKVFHAEKQLDYKTAEEKVVARNKIVKPLLDDFYEFISQVNTPSGQLKNAIKYSFDQRSRLEEIFRIGGMPLSNNEVEQCIRPTTLGRKNSLFSKSYEGAQANAVYYTLVQTAKLNNLDAYKYLKYVLEQLELRKKPDVDAYLPWSDEVQAKCKAHSPADDDMQLENKEAMVKS